MIRISCQNYICRLKAYIVFTFSTLRNKSRKAQPIRTKVGTHAQVKGRQRSYFRRDRLSGGEMGSSKVSPTPEFVSRQYEMTFRQLRNGGFFSKFGHDTYRGWNADFGQKFIKSFYLGVIAPKTPNMEGVKQVSHSEQDTGQGIHCREILFTPLCSPKAREFPRSGQLFVRRTVAELRGVKIAQFSDFGLFYPYKTPKT